MKNAFHFSVIIFSCLILTACNLIQAEPKETICTNHSFGEWNTAIEATCTEVGEKVRSCKCGKTETNKIEATGHNYVESVIPATCEEDGEKHLTCKNCDDVIIEKLSATGHSFTEEAQRENCTLTGTLLRTCVCGKTETEDLAAGHVFTYWTSETDVPNFFVGHKRRDCKYCDYYEAINESIITEVKAEVFATFDNSQYYNASPKIYKTQGGCYVGNCYYQAFIADGNAIAVVGKKNLTTGEITYSIPQPMGHANDMTYNSKTNQIIVCDNQKVLYLYDADTLEFVKKVDLTTRLAAVSYNEHNNTYSGYGNGNIYTIDENFNFIDKFVLRKKGTTSQGICSDSTYVYNTYCTLVPNLGCETFIYVHDHLGNYVTTIEVSIYGHYEPEHISIIDNEMYIMGVTEYPIATLYKILTTN